MEWQIISEAPDYEVSEYGAVRRRLPGWGTQIGKQLKPSQDTKRGYIQYHLSRNKQKLNRYAHRLVALAFIGPPPTDQHQVAHNDGNLINNHFTNLRWATPKENCADRKQHGTHICGEQRWSAKLTEHEVREIRRLKALGHSQSTIGRKFEICPSHVCDIVNRKYWAHIE